MASTDFEADPISFTVIPKAGIELDTTFVKAVCGDNTEWDYSASW